MNDTKYIVTKDENEDYEIFTFPKSVPHNIMAEAISHLRNSTHGSWRRITREPISAGFVNNGKCHGESESLHLKSRPEDTELLSRSI